MGTPKPDGISGKDRRAGFGLAALVERELMLLQNQLAEHGDPKERTDLAREIARLRAVMAKLVEHPGRRKPPESGIAVPAIPPRDPLPTQGGAAAPLEFDS